MRLALLAIPAAKLDPLARRCPLGADEELDVLVGLVAGAEDHAVGGNAREVASLEVGEDDDVLAFDLLRLSRVGVGLVIGESAFGSHAW